MKSFLTYTSLIVITLFLASGCKSAATAMDPQEKASIKELLESRSYRIDVTTVYPQNTATTNRVVNDLMIRTGNSSNRIDVTGDGHFISIDDAIGTANLPFFGERRLGSDYGGNDSGISFDNTIRNYSITDDKNAFKVKFQVRGTNDQYNITLTVFGNKSVTVFVSSADKTNMQYDGDISALPKKE